VFENLPEGQVYEVLLTTGSNTTPVGVTRRGESLKFKLFPGRSFSDILANNKVSIQITRDAELLVKTALNIPFELEVVEKDGWRWVKGLPGERGTVEYRIERWRDEVGDTRVLMAEFSPAHEIEGELPPIPFSRADCILIELAVLFTRYRISCDENTLKKILELSALYRRLGGSSEAFEYIQENIECIR